MLTGLLEKLSQEAIKEIKSALLSDTPLKNLETIRVRYFGKKGRVTQVLKDVGKLDSKERPEAGKLINIAKTNIEQLLADAIKQTKTKEKIRRLEREPIDVTLPGRIPNIGSLHPLTLIEREMTSIFERFGFSVVRGPEVETDWYNFEALNIPKDHPSRDMQDTLYINNELLLRTHTSPVQIRVMQQIKPPLRILCPGAVYRHDFDASHSPMFHQIEGLLVDEEVTFGDLKGILVFFAREFFHESKVRFRPSYFPFTEPSAEMDIHCFICHGKGCSACKHSGWMEILGCGMVDPAVFSFVGYDEGKYQGFAFGIGIERPAMLKFGISDIRLFFENDIRFLRQFQ
jgi:phenylalanyl-tRNA synthetase alpha chain